MQKARAPHGNLLAAVSTALLQAVKNIDTLAAYLRLKNRIIAIIINVNR
jgi:hypothetical protein